MAEVALVSLLVPSLSCFLGLGGWSGLTGSHVVAACRWDCCTTFIRIAEWELVSRGHKLCTDVCLQQVPCHSLTISPLEVQLEI